MCSSSASGTVAVLVVIPVIYQSRPLLAVTNKRRGVVGVGVIIAAAPASEYSIVSGLGHFLRN